LSGKLYATTKTVTSFSLYNNNNNNNDKDFISRGHLFDNTSIFHEGLKQ